MSAYDEWKGLTPAERSVLIAMGPVNALIVKQSKAKAYNETEKRFGYNGHNDKADAFRHCFWSATLARDIGSWWAKAFTNAHETVTGQPANEKEMDLHNNAVGLKIGFFYFIPDSNETLSNKCFAALQNGELKVIKP